MPVTSVLRPSGPDRYRDVARRPDRRAAADRGSRKDRTLLAGARDAVATGTQGWVTQAHLIRTAWQFQPQDITTPVLLWHGTQDQAVPLEQVLPNLRQIHSAHLHPIPDAGHLGWMANQDEIIASLLAD